MIRLTIQRKVFLATFALATTMALVLTLVMRWNLGQGFERYTSAAEFARLDWMVHNIEAEYATHGNWDFVRSAPEQAWRRLSRPNPTAGLDQAIPPRQPEERQPRAEGDYPPPKQKDLSQPLKQVDRPVQPKQDDLPQPPKQVDTLPSPRQEDRSPPPPRQGDRPPPPRQAGFPPPPSWENRPPRPEGYFQQLRQENTATSPAEEPLARAETDFQPLRQGDIPLPPLSQNSPPQPQEPIQQRPQENTAARQVESPPPSPHQPPDTLRIGPRLALLDKDGKRLAGAFSSTGVGAEKPILYQGQAVGRLTLQASPSSVQQLDAAFLASQTQNMLIAGLAALVFSLLASWLLARHLVGPIRDLASGARKIAKGSLDTRINVRSNDELGELGNNFNAMAERLSRIEQSRRTWVSDTSHELRTPLAVLRAEIEAMQDGVRIPDAATLIRQHKQVLQLTKLVDDLRLTLDKEPGGGDMALESISPISVLEECIASFSDRFETAGIELDTMHLKDAGWRMRGDAGRLTQVFGNLLENTLRYTNTGGRLSITLHSDKNRLILQFDDTAPAPPATTLPHLFERFFRAEPSRSRALGGTGLGLAICKTLIEAHGGRIGAALSRLGGLNIYIELPLEKS